MLWEIKTLQNGRCIAGGSNVRKQLCAVAPLRCAVSGEIAPCGLRRCAVAPLLVYAGAVVRAHAVAPLRRCAVLGVLRYPDVRMRRCAVALCRRAGFIKMPGRAYAPLRRCAVASCLDYDATGRAGFVPLLCSCAQCNGATEQRSNGAELRCCGTDALARSNGARSSGAELRRCGTEHRHGGSEQSNGARSNGGELRRCGQSARSTEHGAEHRSTERSNLEDACSTRNDIGMVRARMLLELHALGDGRCCGCMDALV